MWKRYRNKWTAYHFNNPVQISLPLTGLLTKVFGEPFPLYSLPVWSVLIIKGRPTFLTDQRTEQVEKLRCQIKALCGPALWPSHPQAGGERWVGPLKAMTALFLVTLGTLQNKVQMIGHTANSRTQSTGMILVQKFPMVLAAIGHIVCRAQARSGGRARYLDQEGEGPC